MENFVQLCLGSLCVLAPVVLVLLSSSVYALGVGAIKLPGISRQVINPKIHWITVPDLAHKVSETVAAVISLIGTLFGLLGFLLPWVSINVGAASDMLNLGGLNGTLSGIALAFQSLIAGVGLLSADFKGASSIGAILIVVSLLVSLIPLALLASAAMGIGLISVPLGLVKMDIRRLARGLLVTSFISLCLACSFFASIQATVGGVKVGGSEGLFGSEISMGVEVTSGFWITIGGLVLALVGAIVANTFAGALSNWAKNLASLETGADKTDSTLKE